MANAVEQKARELWGRLQNGPVGKFLKWWIEELKLAMPASWQEKLQHAMRRVTLESGDGDLTVSVDENRGLTELQTLTLSSDTSLQRQEIGHLLESNDLAEAPIFLLLDLSGVLAKEIKLPQAAESNLAQVLSFEMDRQTPFRASTVYYDWEVLERGAQLRLKLYVVPRNEVDDAVKNVREKGFQLAGVDVRDGQRTLGLNLLPAEQRVRLVNRKARANLVFGAAAVVLLAMVMVLSLSLREHQIGELEEAIASVQGEARKVAQIRKQIEDTSEAAGFLATRRAESPLAIELLADITRILPDDTYLDRLVINKSSVQIQGKSRNAQQLIEVVNNSPLLYAAAFRGSTRLDARTGLEIFEINAQVDAEAVN
jgi:general secretion pathway protein L